MHLLSALCLLTAYAPADTVEVPFHVTENAIIVDATVNGHGVSLMFDTGFGGAVILNDSVDIGPATGTTTLRDFVGQFQARTVKIKVLKVGSKTVESSDKEVIQQPMGRMTDGYGVHCDGILGLSALKNYITEINFQRHMFIFHPKTYDISVKTPDNVKTFLCKMLMTGMNAVDLTVTASTGKKLTLALDTGNAFFATTHKDVLQRVGLWPEDREAKFQKLSGVASGAVASWEYKMKDATIFGVPVKESYWDIIDAPSSSAEGDGTVGFGFLSNFNVTLDYERRRVWLENFTGKSANDSPGDLGISAGYDESLKRVIVYLVAPESPADQAKIVRGDYLLSIGGTDTGNSSYQAMSKMLEGPLDSKVLIAWSHNGVLMRQELTRKRLVNE